ncbi:MAG: hypothetical protein M3Q23_13380 [Actinomycetota bacterium]|nr:hypothetical protein [Actinomycetota bacterium]
MMVLAGAGSLGWDPGFNRTRTWGLLGGARQEPEEPDEGGEGLTLLGIALFVAPQLIWVGFSLLG